MSIDNILNSPALTGMRAIRQWVVYVLVPSATRANKTDKIPLHHATGSAAGVTDPNSWTDVHTAAAAARRWGATFGVGFVFTEGCGYWFVDIDSCLIDGAWTPFATATCSALAGCAVEVSSSGKGLHLFGRGAVPPHSSKNAENHAELYTSGRFCAVSGAHLSGSCDVDLTAAIGRLATTYFPARVGGGLAIPEDGPRADWRGPTDDDDLIRRALMSRSAASVFGAGRASFADLWHADEAALGRAYPADANSHEPYDRSSADAALAQMLCFWTGCDIARIERLMRQSKLVREKWDDRGDYLVGRTITNACRMQRDVLKDKPTQVELTEIPPSAPEARMTAVQGSTFAGRADQERLFAGCVYVVDLHRVLVPGGGLLTPERFRAKFGGYTFAMDERNERTTRNAFEAFTESQMLKCPIVDGVCFRPDLPPAHILVEPGRTRVNTYSPAQVPRKKGDPSLLLDHLRRLLPDERDRGIVLSYMAAIVQYPGVKFQWAIVLQGVEGNGKTFLSRCVAEAVGRRYVHWPKANKLNKQFNGWMVGKIVYCVEDIHTSENVDVVEELKPMITGGDGLEIEAKNVDQISTEICGNFMFNTNHHAGLRKTRNDRRFCVLYTAQQMVEDLARDGMAGDYMQRIYDWAKSGGYAVITDYLMTFPIPPEFNPATNCQRAPRTSSTEAAIAAGLGRVEQEVVEAVEAGRTGFMGGWVSSGALDKLLQECGKAGQVPPNKRRDMMRSIGYDWHPALAEGRVDNPVAPDGVKVKLFVRSGHPAIALTDRAAVAKAYATAQGVGGR